jgi:hypothetical protein
VRVGFVVDGVSEVGSLPNLYPALSARSGHRFDTPIKANLQPTAPIGTIVGACVKSVQQVFARRADLAVVLLDRESRPECPGDLAYAILQGLSKKNAGGDIAVVVKNRMFENWLIADLGALRSQRGRYAVSKSVQNQVENNKADNVEGLKLLKHCCKSDYRKVEDAKKILAKADPGTMGLHSRSFRRMLRCIHDPDYLTQSRNPMPS